MSSMSAGLRWTVFLFSLVLVTCNYNHFKVPSPDHGVPPRLDKPDGTGIGYQKVYSEVIEPYCLNCHRSGQYSLVDYPKTVLLLDKIQRAVFVNASMPPFGVLPDAERALLLHWLNNNAPEVGIAPSPRPEPLPIQPTYSSIRDRIFKVRCGSCHDPISSYCTNRTIEAEGLKLTNQASCQLELLSFAELTSGEEETRKELVIPGNPDESQLVISIERRDGVNQMPPPAEGYAPLSPSEIGVIRNWITAGAPNN